MFILPCLPCRDIEDGSHLQMQQTISGTGSGAQHGHHEEEACSPFCSCNCCGQNYSPNFHFPKIAVKKMLVSSVKEDTYSGIFLPSDFFGNIWQPPKLG